MQCESDIKNSYFRSGQQINYSRFQQIQVIFTSQTYESCHPLTCKARILNLPRGSLHQRQDQWIASPRCHRCVKAHNSASDEKDARIPAKRREHCFSATYKGAEEKHELYIRTCWPSDSWVQLEKSRVKEAEEHTFQILFISGSGSGFSPRSRSEPVGSRSRVSSYPPYMEVKSNGSTKKQAPTTLLPLFPATNPDIPLKEIKAFYPLQTPGETQDLCLSKCPRLNPSTSCKKRKFPVKDSRIRLSTRKEDSRQSDRSFSDIQETLRLAHPRGIREQPEEVTKRHRQKENIYRSSCARALVPRSLKVLKDKSTGPPREVASTPQQRSPFLQGPVTETYVGYKTGKQILSSTEIQDQGPKSYNITFEQVHNLDVLIKTPVYHLEKPLSSRTLVFIHQHEEVPNPTLTTKLRLRPLLLSLTPGKNERVRVPAFGSWVPGPKSGSCLRSRVPAPRAPEFDRRKGYISPREDLLLREVYDRLIPAINTMKMMSYALCSTPTTPQTGPGHDLQHTDIDTPCSSKHIEAPCSLQHIDYSTICFGHVPYRTNDSYHLQRPRAHLGYVPPSELRLP
ncbi:hypothetical protein Bca52824_087098 [Brassica carinata]|uniref:Uncharacterized protein n=1 Tax=Brassica carinata TaxID=52824 RepID=A0A8X7TMG3_BRACI|nr:hypothetical protein Bca52824_087098 [Brassica carinata]